MTSFPFLEGGGEMGEIVSTYDWSKTRLGTPGQWPQSLRTTLGILLHSAFPMLLFWGEDLVCFYNDAFRPSLGIEGKHPGIGKKGREVWADIWEFIGPLIKQVMDTGQPVYFEDQSVPFYRNGRMEEIYWTFSYSPAYGDDSQINGVFVTCTETTAKVLTEKRLNDAADNLRNIILQSPVAMCIFRGPTHIVDIANDRMLELWGRKETDVLSKPIFEGLPEAKDQGFEALLDKVFRTGETVVAHGLPITLPRDGTISIVYVNFAYEAYREPDGRISGVMAVASDVTAQALASRSIEAAVAERTTELNRANEALSISNLQLKRSNNYLEEFAYAASHDLKEPIRKIFFFTDRLKTSMGQGMTVDQHQYFERLDIAATRMGNLIDDLLSYSEVSHLPQLTEKVDLNELLAEVLLDLDLEIEEKKAIITIGKLCTINGHSRQLRQAFSNLVGNALKYNIPGVPPVIEITAETAQGNNAGEHSCLVKIKDNGIGFEQQHSEKIFKLFTRLHGNAEYKGTGVGLSLVRKVVEHHGGTITATSAPGKGATFRVFLPGQ